MNSSSSSKCKGSLKDSKDGHSSVHSLEHVTRSDSEGLTTAAVRIKKEGGLAGQSAKSVQGQSLKSTTPHSGSSSGGQRCGGSLANVKTLERPRPDQSGSTLSGGSRAGVPDTPLTHLRTGGKPINTAFVTSSSGQRTSCNSVATESQSGTNTNSHSVGNNPSHPLEASSTMPSSASNVGESHPSGRQSSAQTARSSHAQVNKPVTRSSIRASSPSTCGGDARPVALGSPSEKNAKSAEKLLGGLSSEEARKLRQAQQKLQKEQWIKKYGQGTKRTLEMPSGASNGDRLMPRSNLDVEADDMENGILISDGEWMLIGLGKGRPGCALDCGQSGTFLLQTFTTDAIYHVQLVCGHPPLGQLKVS